MTNKLKPPRKWMRPCQMAKALGTSNQNVNNLISRGKLERKYNALGVALVRGKAATV